MEPFEQKPMPEPMLDQTTRNQIAGVSKPSSFMGSVGEFYGTNKLYVWAILGALIVVSVLAYFAFRPNQATVKEAKVDIAIDVPETTPSGAELVYKIRIQNQDPEDLIGMELELVYPNDVTYVSSVPEAKNISGTLFPVPDLLAGQSATLFVKTKARGNINEEKKLGAKLRYKFKNFSSEFIKNADISVRIVASDVALDFSGPREANNSQLVSYELKYVNNSENEITNARIQVTYPEGFGFAAGTPEPSLSSNIWTVGTVRPGDKGTITFQGNFKQAQLGASAEFKAVLQSLDQQGNYFAQAENAFVTKISSLPLVVSHELQGSSSHLTAKPGETLSYEVDYQNNAAVVASGVIIVLTLDSKVIDLGTIQAEGGQVNNNTITWNASGVPNLERLNPSETGRVSFNVKIKTQPVKDTSENLEVKTTIKIKSDEYETFLPGNDLAIKLETIAELSGATSYISGNQPPQVGKQSTYEVRLSLKNTTNDLTGSVLTAFVPVAAGGFQQASVLAKEKANVTFDPSTGKVTWKVGTLSAHSGDFEPARDLSFSIQFTPTASQVGKTVTLLNKIQFSGKDSHTGIDIKLSGNDLSTGDTGGNFGDGRVEP